MAIKDFPSSSQMNGGNTNKKKIQSPSPSPSPSSLSFNNINNEINIKTEDKEEDNEYANSIVRRNLQANPSNPNFCRPNFGMKRAACDFRIQNGCDMEWFGMGCKRPCNRQDRMRKTCRNGVSTRRRFSDGGCQFRGYCGFNCDGRCDGTQGCEWIDSQCQEKACEIVFNNVLRNMEWTLQDPETQGPLSCFRNPQGYSVVPFNTTTPFGSTFEIDEEGQFKYTPAIDLEGSESIELSILFGGEVDSQATVTFNVGRRVWFFDSLYNDFLRRKLDDDETEVSTRAQNVLKRLEDVKKSVSTTKEKADSAKNQQTEHRHSEHHESKRHHPEHHESKRHHEKRNLLGGSGADETIECLEEGITFPMLAETGTGFLGDPFSTLSYFVEEGLLGASDALFFYQGDYWLNEDQVFFVNDGVTIFGQSSSYEPDLDFYTALGLEEPDGGLVTTIPLPSPIATHACPDMAVILTGNSEGGTRRRSLQDVIPDLDSISVGVIIESSVTVKGITFVDEDGGIAVLAVNSNKLDFQYPTGIVSFSEAPGLLVLGAMEANLNIALVFTQSILLLGIQSGKVNISFRDLQNGIVDDGSECEDSLSGTTGFFSTDFAGGIIPDLALLSGIISVQNNVDFQIECVIFTTCPCLDGIPIFQNLFVRIPTDFEELIPLDFAEASNPSVQSRAHALFQDRKTVAEEHEYILEKLHLKPIIDSAFEMMNKHGRELLNDPNYDARNDRKLQSAVQNSLHISRCLFEDAILGIINLNAFSDIAITQNFFSEMFVGFVSLSLSFIDITICANEMYDMLFNVLILDLALNDKLAIEMTNNFGDTYGTVLAVIDLTILLLLIQLLLEQSIELPPPIASNLITEVIFDGNDFVLDRQFFDPGMLGGFLGETFDQEELNGFQCEYECDFGLVLSAVFTISFKPVDISLTYNWIDIWADEEEISYFSSISTYSLEDQNRILIEGNDIFEENESYFTSMLNFFSCSEFLLPIDILGYDEYEFDPNLCKDHVSYITVKDNDIHTFSYIAEFYADFAATVHTEISELQGASIENSIIFESYDEENFCISAEEGPEYVLQTAAETTVNIFRIGGGNPAITPVGGATFTIINQPCVVLQPDLEPSCDLDLPDDLLL